MKRFGLIGKSLEHSFSKTYFEKKFSKNNLDATYENLELNEIEAFFPIISKGEFNGFNVTIPYKESIIPFLTELDDTAKFIGAVNTIKIDNERVTGYNTDAYGFHQSIKPFLTPQHSRALILGTGGASKAIAYVLDQLGIHYLFVSRNPKYDNEINYSDLNEHYINAHLFIINTTPLGTFPNIDFAPDIPYESIGKHHFVYDLVYNPEETQFLKRSKAQGALTMNGLNMLKHQAEKAWEIWNQ